MNSELRRLELSNKILQMGQALLKEGREEKDYTIGQSGTIMLLIAALITSEEDMFIFSELCAMFSAKKILDATENIDPMEKHLLSNVLLKKKKEIVKRRSGKKPKDGDAEPEN